VCHIDVHDEPSATNQFGDICSRKEVLITVMDGRHVQAGRVQCIDPESSPVRRADDLHPTTIGAKTELLRDDVRKLIGGRFPDAEKSTRISVRHVFQRSSAVPPQSIEAFGELEGDTDTREIDE